MRDVDLTSGRIRLKRHLRPEVVVGDATYFLADSPDRPVTAILGEDIALLVPLLDGTRDLAGLAAELSSALPPAVLGGALGSLLQAGLACVDLDPAPSAEDAAYWELAGADGGDALRAITGTPVEICAAGSADPLPVLTALLENGVAATLAERPTPSADALGLVVTEDYLLPELATYDRAFAAAGRPWLLAKPGGCSPWVGPLFGVDDTAPCWTCLAARLRANRVVELPLERALAHAGPLDRPRPSTASTRAIGAHLAALQLTKWLAGCDPRAGATLLTFDSVSAGWRRHEVRRRPQCRVCGDPDLVAERADRPVELDEVHLADPRPPAALTRARYDHLVGPVTGVVRELRHDPRSPAGVFCCLAPRTPSARTLRAVDVAAATRESCGGAGPTRLDAEVSALCEALERYSGELHGDERRIRASFAELGAEAIHPNDVLLFDERQYGTNTADTALFQQVPERFEPDAPIDWSPVWSVSQQRRRLLPTAMLYYDCCSSGDVAPVSGGRFVVADSNGAAAGPTLGAAVVHGFLELVERDAAALWWYNRSARPALDLAAFPDATIAAQRAVHVAAGRELWALDLTSDLGIPVVVAISRRVGHGAEDILLGFGAHFDPVVAARRAVVEVAQLLPAVAHSTGDGGGYGSDAPDLLSWWRTATVAAEPYLAPDPDVPARTPASWPAPPTGDAVAAIVALLREHNLELLVVDQTRPDIELPVVKVIVPGLRQFWARFAPGRLYDVPVRLGRQARALRYDELNPIPLFV